MVLGIIKQAVQIKMTSKTESPLISEAEYCYACTRAFRELSAPEEMIENLRNSSSVEEAREQFTPYFKEKRELYREEPQMNRLLSLLIHCRVEGAITEEVHQIIE